MVAARQRNQRVGYFERHFDSIAEMPIMHRWLYRVIQRHWHLRRHRLAHPHFGHHPLLGYYPLSFSKNDVPAYQVRKIWIRPLNILTGIDKNRIFKLLLFLATIPSTSA